MKAPVIVAALRTPIARARISTCQCASPVGTVNAAGMLNRVAPLLLSAVNRSAKRRS